VLLNRKPPEQADLQFGFTRGLSPKMASLILRECIVNSRKDKQPLYVCTLDAVKAFDTVSHALLLRKLYHEGVDLESWAVIKSLYEDMSSKVKWKGITSTTIDVKQGVRQGGVLSPDLYKTYINGLLCELKSSGHGSRIGTTYVGCPGVADDIMCIAPSPEGLQSMLNIAGDYSNREQYDLHPLKSEITQFDCKMKPADYNWSISGVNKGVNGNITHLGIVYQGCTTRGHLSGPWVKDKLSMTRRTVYGLMGTGLHGSNGIGPAISVVIYRCYVLPRLLYGLDVAELNITQMSEVRSQHLSMLRRFQSLPDSTATSAIYLLSGTMPIDGEIDISRLGLVGQILRSGNTSIQDVLAHQYATQPFDSTSWFVQVAKLLLQYGLPPLHQLAVDTPSKDSWKRQVKCAVHEYWTKWLHSDCGNRSTLVNFNIPHSMVGSVHHVWAHVEPCVKDVRRAIVKTKMLVGCYPTQERRARWSEGDIDPTCLLCKTAAETVTHLLLECPALHRAREKQLTCLATEVVSRVGIEVWRSIHQNPANLTKLLLDCSWYMDAGILPRDHRTFKALELHSR
jgi:hypothetical protein